MKMQKIRKIAEKKGIKPDVMDRTSLIRAIQRAEGNPDCFGTKSTGECGQLNCLWRADCSSVAL